MLVVTIILLLLVLLEQLYITKKGLREMSANITRLQNAVAAIQDDADVIVGAIQELRDMIKTLQGQLDAGAADAAAIEAASTTLEQVDARLDALSSPPEPAPEPAPEPTPEPEP
jgi:prefoldin subunit 5